MPFCICKKSVSIVQSWFDSKKSLERYVTTLNNGPHLSGPWTETLSRAGHEPKPLLLKVFDWHHPRKHFLSSSQSLGSYQPLTPRNVQRIFVGIQSYFYGSILGRWKNRGDKADEILFCHWNSCSIQLQEGILISERITNSYQIFPVWDLGQKLEDKELLFYEVRQVRFSALSLQSCLSSCGDS